MAVTSCHKLWEGRGGSADFQMRRTYTQVFEVYTDSVTDDAVIAGTVPVGVPDVLPAMGDPHQEDPYAIVTGRAPSQDAADPLRWLVTITYDTQPGGGTQGGTQAQQESLQPAENGGAAQSPGNRSENPLQRPASWKGTFQQVQEVLRSAYKTDQDGNNIGGSVAVTNSAGFLFDPPVMVEESRHVITITKNYSSLSLASIKQLRDSVNKTAWKGFPPRTLRVVGIEYSSAFENGVAFWQVTYSLAEKEDTWDIRVLDAGLCERWQIGTDSGTGAPIYEFRTILDKHGNPVTEPVPLSNGKKLAPGAPEAYLVFSGYRQREFNTLIVI